MKSAIWKIFVFCAALTGALATVTLATDTTKYEYLPYPVDNELLRELRTTDYRGKIYAYHRTPSYVKAAYDYRVFFDGEKDEPTLARSLRIDFKRQGEKGFCGTYIVLLADISQYKTLMFRVRGARGGENFLIGLADAASHNMETATYGGSIYRYLRGGPSDDWREVTIPLSDFVGLDFKNFFGVTFLFEDEGNGTIYIDDIRFAKEKLVDRQEEIVRERYMVLDDFDHADINNLGMPTGCFNRFPSYAAKERTGAVKHGESGKSLHLTYNRLPAGWTGYYSQLHSNRQRFTDLRMFSALSFWVKGAEGGEMFTVGMADRDHILIDNSVVLDEMQMEEYMPGGADSEWSQITIPLSAFEGLDLSTMGALHFIFEEEGKGNIYLDDIRFLAGQEEITKWHKEE